MFNNPYMQNAYNPQASIDRINNQIAELEKMKAQIPQNIAQPTNLTQNFQLAPSSGSLRYAESIEDVHNDFVIGDTPFFSKDMSVLWIKNTKGEIKTYELSEIIPKDEKDIQIELLTAQINELKGMIDNDANVKDVDGEQTTTDSTTDNESVGTTTKKSKSTSISRVSTSKEK